ncbi:MAG: HEAT repeat domain-containing protein [Chloroflexota bacterium]
MALQSIPFERRIHPTDSNAATGFDNPLVENFFKKVQSVPQYQLQDIDARTVKYYGGSVESSTSKFADSGLLDKQANSIFAGAKEEIFEDGMESDFSRNLSEFIASFGHSAMEVIIPIILSEHTNTDVASEAYRILGRLNHRITYRDRLWLLERGLYSASARGRDGAILGLAFLNDPLAIASLKSAIEREPNSELRKDMEQILAQLEGNEDGIPSKKDTKE